MAGDACQVGQHSGAVRSTGEYLEAYTPNDFEVSAVELIFRGSRSPPKHYLGDIPPGENYGGWWGRRGGNGLTKQAYGTASTTQQSTQS
jgi:hypothetical protein